MELSDRLKARSRPDQKTLIHQDWHNLLFLHWACSPELIQKTLPKGLFVDTFEGQAYLGIIPFSIRNQSLAGILPFPGLTSFFEINVRTYVHDVNGTPGVWFYSLDINSSLAAMVGRFYYNLPYTSSSIKAFSTDEEISFTVKRAESVRFVYKPMQPLGQAALNTLEFFLVERYILFSQANERLYTAQVHHEPYPLFQADIKHYSEQPFLWNGLPQFARKPDHVLFSNGVDVDIFNLKALGVR